jgi:capsular polysaccharide transport system permease protein
MLSPPVRASDPGEVSDASGDRGQDSSTVEKQAMNMHARRAEGRLLKAADRQNGISQSLRQIARVPGLVERKKGVRSYQSHIKSDPWLPILFVLCFVLPTLAGGLYYGLLASDRYVTEAQFAIRPMFGTADKATPDAVGTNAGIPKEMIAQDTLIAQEYILSRPMLEAIEAQLPIRTWFSSDSIDYPSRLNPDKPIEKLLRYWKRRVSVDIESGTGIMTLSVEAFDPDESLAITRAVMEEAERMVNALSIKPRQDAVDESARELKLADERVAAARAAVNALRNREGVLDAVKSNEVTLKTVSELQLSRAKLAIQLAVIQRDLSPEARSVVDLKQQIKDLDSNIARIVRELASIDPDQKRRLSNALTQFEALESKRAYEEKYREQVRLAFERARILAAQKAEAFVPVVPAIRAQSSTEPRRILMTSLITAAAAMVFAAAMFARKLLAH